MHLHQQILAVLSTGIYFAGLTYFKMAAAGMRPLQGSRPFVLTRVLLTSTTWISGAVVLVVGAAVQAAALTGLSLFEALPMFLSGLALLLVFAFILGERLTLREWGCVMLLAVAAALFAHAPPRTRWSRPPTSTSSSSPRRWHWGSSRSPCNAAAW